MSKSCKGLAMELVKCLSESDCVKVEKRSYRECAGEKSPSISSECVGLRETYFNCKRGQFVGEEFPVSTCRKFILLTGTAYKDREYDVDMRARIRGNKGY